MTGLTSIALSLLLMGGTISPAVQGVSTPVSYHHHHGNGGGQGTQTGNGGTNCTGNSGANCTGNPRTNCNRTYNTTTTTRNYHHNAYNHLYCQ